MSTKLKTNDSARPFIIPIFLPQAGCPHQCVFCNQHVITSVKRIPSAEKLHLLINDFLQYKGKNRNKVQIAFYGGNFLGLKKDYIKLLLCEAAKFVSNGKIDSIRFSTRPDTINNENLDILKEFPVETIELGVQSMDDNVLAVARRKHTSQDTKQAVKLLKRQNYEIGLQMMTGLPDDNENGAFFTCAEIIKLNPDFVRIYPTVVLKNSPLANWYKKGDYAPMPLEQCVTLVKNLYLSFEASKIPVIRMGLQASETLDTETILAGPYHPAFGHLVHSEIFLDIASKIIKYEMLTNKISETIIIKTHPKDISKIRGLNNANIKILKRKFKIKSLKIVQDSYIKQDCLSIFEA